MAIDNELKSQGERRALAGKLSETEIDRTLMDSFPASDPPWWTLGARSTQTPAVSKDDDHTEQP